MARVPIDQRTPIAQWLIRARQSQGEGYTVDRFLDELTREVGQAPSRSNYAQWESGAVTPRQSNLDPVIRFWEARGVAGPGAAPAPTVDPLIAALAAQTKAITDLVVLLQSERTADWERIERLEATVAGLVAAALDAPGTAAGASPDAHRTIAG
jgi:hypothetical protein